MYETVENRLGKVEDVDVSKHVNMWEMQQLEGRRVGLSKHEHGMRTKKPSNDER